MKTKFILPFIMLNLLTGFSAIVMFWYSNWDPIWIGLFFTTFPLPFFLMALVKALGISHTSEKLPLFQIISFTGLALVFYSLYTRGGPSGLSEYVAAGLALLGALSYQWYIHIFSPYKRKESTAISNGHKLPELPLTLLDGTEISSSSFDGAKTLMVFFRATWCPFCMNQLKQVVAQSERLQRAGVQVKFISNQGIDNSIKLSKDLNLPQNFKIYQDEDLKAARRLGIEDIGGSPVGMSGFPPDTVMATVIALEVMKLITIADAHTQIHSIMCLSNHSTSYPPSRLCLSNEK